MATSTPQPSVSAITWSFQSASPELHAIRGSELLGLLHPVGVQVDRDDPGRPVEAGGRDRGESHRTGADHGDRVTGLHLPVLDPDLETGRQDVAESITACCL